MGVWRRCFNGDASAKLSNGQRRRPRHKPASTVGEFDSSALGSLPASQTASRIQQDAFLRRARRARVQLLQWKLCKRASQRFLHTVHKHSSIPALNARNAKEPLLCDTEVPACAGITLFQAGLEVRTPDGPAEMVPGWNLSCPCRNFFLRLALPSTGHSAWKRSPPTHKKVAIKSGLASQPRGEGQLAGAPGVPSFMLTPSRPSICA